MINVLWAHTSVFTSIVVLLILVFASLSMILSPVNSPFPVRKLKQNRDFPIRSTWKTYKQTWSDTLRSYMGKQMYIELCVYICLPPRLSRSLKKKLKESVLFCFSGPKCVESEVVWCKRTQVFLHLANHRAITRPPVSAVKMQTHNEWARTF